MKGSGKDEKKKVQPDTKTNPSGKLEYEASRSASLLASSVSRFSQYKIATVSERGYDGDISRSSSSATTPSPASTQSTSTKSTSMCSSRSSSGQSPISSSPGKNQQERKPEDSFSPKKGSKWERENQRTRGENNLYRIIFEYTDAPDL